LDTLTRVDFSRVDVPLRVHGDVVHDMKLTGKAARTSDAAEDRVGRAVHNAYLVVDAVDHEQRRLLTIR